MKVTQLKYLIKEEVNNYKLLIYETQFNRTIKQLESVALIKEGLIADMLNLILEPKYRKKAEALKNSAEYKELQQQIKTSTEALQQLATRLKKSIDGYQTTVNSMQKAGIKVKPGMSGEQMFKAYKDWQTKMNKTAGIKSSGISDWEKYFK